MSNDFFRFKQFTVQQEHCAMKVSTDACIQGAWTPIGDNVKKVLDIGAGTGLLSLMLAQRTTAAMIDAIELSAAVAAQATDNARRSPFADRIQVIQADAVKWQAAHQYDLIICNPPFFKNALLSPDTARNAARHADTLNNDALIHAALTLLTQRGYASFLLPKGEYEAFSAQAEIAGIYRLRQLSIRHLINSEVSRMIGIFGREKPHSMQEETLIIKDEQEKYTQAFVQLLAPFYLHL